MPCPILLFAHRQGSDPRGPLIKDDDVISHGDERKGLCGPIVSA
jgi:hypothetical protein